MEGQLIQIFTPRGNPVCRTESTYDGKIGVSYNCNAANGAMTLFRFDPIDDQGNGLVLTDGSRVGVYAYSLGEGGYDRVVLVTDSDSLVPEEEQGILWNPRVVSFDSKTGMGEFHWQTVPIPGHETLFVDPNKLIGNVMVVDNAPRPFRFKLVRASATHRNVNDTRDPKISVDSHGRTHIVLWN